MSVPAKFAPFSTFIEPEFWSELSRRKLNEWQLEEGPFEVRPYFVNTDRSDLPCRMIFDYDSVRDVPGFSQSRDGCKVRVSGKMYIYNTLESFNAVDRVKMVQEAAVENLKKHQYHFWMCYPAATISELAINSEGPSNHIDKFLNENQLLSLQKWYSKQAVENLLPTFFWARFDGDCLCVYDFDKLLQSDFNVDISFLAFMDPSTFHDNTGWPLRNVLTSVLLHRPLTQNLKVIALRAKRVATSACPGVSFDLAGSRIFTFKFSGNVPEGDIRVCGIGWERNNDGKLKAKCVDMRSSMDPAMVAESALDLNLQLMRWRLMPELNLDTFKVTKCLLFGAGTLGCSVARLLLAWGVRHITFIDNGTISLSNPARQSLFTHADAVGNLPKAPTAATRLQEIHPGVTCEGHVIHVPMPGHTVAPNERVQFDSTVAQLNSMVRSHDVILLLTDSREARWLPAVLAAANDKSLHDRTLDQQCTVVRPGVSNLASGILVELLAAVLQHPLGAHAPATVGNDATEECASCLGSVPHQVRGHLARFGQMVLTVARFDQCVACSDIVRHEWAENGADFILQVCNDPTSLEKLTKLDQIHESAANIDLWEYGDSDSIGSSANG